MVLSSAIVCHHIEIPETKGFIPKGFELGATIELANDLVYLGIQAKKIKYVC